MHIAKKHMKCFIMGVFIAVFFHMLHAHSKNGFGSGVGPLALLGIGEGKGGGRGGAFWARGCVVFVCGVFCLWRVPWSFECVTMTCLWAARCGPAMSVLLEKKAFGGNASHEPENPSSARSLEHPAVACPHLMIHAGQQCSQFSGIGRSWILHELCA